LFSMPPAECGDAPDHSFKRGRIGEEIIYARSIGSVYKLWRGIRRPSKPKPPDGNAIGSRQRFHDTRLTC
jgi:hypothetical protein